MHEDIILKVFVKYLPPAKVKLTDNEVTQAVIEAGLLNFSSNRKYNIPAALFKPAGIKINDEKYEYWYLLRILLHLFQKVVNHIQ